MLFKIKRMKRNWYLFIVCLLCVCLLPRPAEAQTQNEKKITLEFNNERLPSVLKRLEKVSGYKILFTYDDVKKFTVSGSVKDKSIKQALDIILIDKPLEYHIDGQFITITPTGPSKPAKIFDVNGVVISGDDGQPLIGATVQIKGSKSGVLTDLNGKFFIEKVASNSILQFSYIGMHPQELTATPTMSVTLNTDVQTLSEVVVTGMQKMDKRLFTGATAQLSAEEVKLDGMPEISRALEGRAAGVSVQNVSGTFGTAPKIRVRGATSIYGSSKPLWVVDGVIMEDAIEVGADDLSSGDAETLISSAIAGLNADDIESFQILKDGSATSIYGARAMAGVIVVTTKKGKAGINKISYTGEFTTRMIPTYNEFNIMNSQEQMGVYKEMEQKGWLNYSDIYRAANSGVYGRMYKLINTFDPVTGQYAISSTEEMNAYLREAEMRNTDWFDALFSNNISQNHSVSITSGTEKSSFYASLSAMLDPGWYKQSEVKRYTANVNTTYNVLKNLSVNLISSASYRKQKAPGTISSTVNAANGEVSRSFDINPYSYAINTSRAMDPNAYYTSNYAPFNILHELDNNYIELNVVDVKFQGEIKWKALPELEFSALGSLKYQASSQEHNILDNSNQATAYRTGMDDATIRNNNGLLYSDPDDIYSLPISILPRGGIYQRKDYKMLGLDFRATASWNHLFAEKHITNAFGGMEVNDLRRSYTMFNGWGMQYSMGETPSYVYQFFKKGLEADDKYYALEHSLARSVATFANVTYSYDGRYTMNGTFRYEGTNRMGRSHSARWLPTWNLSGAWNAHEENIFKKLEPTLSHLTLKVSYSLTADRGPANVTNSQAIFRAYSPYRPFTDIQEPGIFMADSENSELTYEKKHELNIGGDIGFLDNRINLALDWYKRNNYDLIGAAITPGVGGGGTYTYANVASMESHGIEFTLSTQNIKKKNFSWSTDFIFSHTKNKVTDLKSLANVMDLISGNGFAREGYPVRGLFSIPFVGLDKNGLPLFDINGKITSTEIEFQARDNIDYLKYEGPTDPTITGSLGNVFTYKGFKLNVFLTYSFGNVVRLDPVFKASYSDLTAMPREFKNRWTLPGDESQTDIPAIISYPQYSHNLNLSYAYNAYNYSTARIAKGDFIRMKEISLAYEFPRTWLNPLKISNLSLKLQATNLFLLYADKKLNGQDPEFFNTGGVASPVPRQFTLTLRLGL